MRSLLNRDAARVASVALAFASLTCIHAYAVVPTLTCGVPSAKAKARGCRGSVRTGPWLPGDGGAAAKLPCCGGIAGDDDNEA